MGGKTASPGEPAGRVSTINWRPTTRVRSRPQRARILGGRVEPNLGELETMKQTRTLPIAAVVAAALLLGGCGQSGAQAPTSGADAQSAGQSQSEGVSAAPVGDTKACFLAGPAGPEDKDLTDGSKAGLARAEKELGVETSTAEAKAETEIAPALQRLVDDECDMIFGVGETMAAPLDEAAKDNPAVKFVLVDAALPKHPKNARSIIFDVPDASFLAGYAAAAMTPTGKVAAFVNSQDPQEARTATAFVGGVSEYNETHGKAIEVVDWDGSQMEGPSIDAATAEEQKTAGKKQAAELITRGAGIIFPPSGPAGAATLDEAKTNGETWVIWTGADGAATQPDYESIILTSVLKNSEQAVFDNVQAVTEGAFTSAPYVGDLENGAVGLAPWHKFDGLVPADVKTEIDQLKEQIIAGKVTVPTQSPLD